MRTPYTEREPPPGWKRVALGYVASIDYGYPFAAENFTSDETEVPVIRIRDVKPGIVQTFAHAERPHEGAWVADGDIVIGMDGDFNHVRWAAGRAAMNQRVCALRPGSDADARYLDYAIGIPLTAINETVHYTTVKHLSMEALRSQPVYLPPRDTQRRIADMLDAATARIDTLIEKNDQLKLLTGLRSRSLQESLTRLTDDKDGVPLRFLMREVDERVGNAESSLPLLSVSIASGVGRRRMDNFGQVAGDDLSNYKICQTDDIVINRMRAFQGAVGVASEVGVVSSDYAVLRSLQGVPRFFHYLMRSDWFVAEMTRRLRGIGGPSSSSVRTPRVNVGDLGRIVMPFPTDLEQREIVSQLDRSADKLARVRKSVDRQQELLRLRRQALITAAVTGQIDV